MTALPPYHYQLSVVSGHAPCSRSVTVTAHGRLHMSNHDNSCRSLTYTMSTAHLCLVTTPTSRQEGCHTPKRRKIPKGGGAPHRGPTLFLFLRIYGSLYSPWTDGRYVAAPPPPLSPPLSLPPLPPLPPLSRSFLLSRLFFPLKLEARVSRLCALPAPSRPHPTPFALSL